LLATLNGKGAPLLMDRAMRVIKCVCSLKSKSLLQWFLLRRIVNILGSDTELYKFRNEVERFFLRIKCFRRVFTRYGKLDIIYAGVIIMALIYDAILM
jgi:hypothetical protein